MQKVTVTTTATHIDDQGIIRKVPEVYETSKNYAELRKGAGLVDFDGDGKKVTGQPLLHAGVTTDNEMTTTAIVNQAGDDQNLVPVKKADLSKSKAADKAISEKKATHSKAETIKDVKAEKNELPVTKPEKVEGEFPGSVETNK